MGVRNGRIFHPGVYLGVRKWRILCVISANFPPGVGGRFFARGVRFSELPGIRKGGRRGLGLEALEHVPSVCRVWGVLLTSGERCRPLRRFDRLSLTTKRRLLAT